jgi:hypothetical protein
MEGSFYKFNQQLTTISYSNISASKCSTILVGTDSKNDVLHDDDDDEDDDDSTIIK